MWHQGFNRNFTKLRHPSLLVHHLYILVRISKAGQKIANCSVQIFRHVYEDCFMYSVHLLLVKKLQCIRVLCQKGGSCVSSTTCMSWCSRERMSKTDTEEKKLLNNVFIFVFFTQKKYSCSFRKLWLNHWCHMDFFNNVFTTFLGLECVCCIVVSAESESSRI